MQPGICLVISPLIALMKDQVEQLQRRNIPAEAVYSGMTKRSIDYTLDRCVYGDVKFLYVSPERLQTDLLSARVQKMQVNLLAVDEAHCISQWGYDFRPPYLEIGNFRKEQLPKVSCIALTATATPKVQADIVEKLQFNKGHQLFSKSFARNNLSYVVRPTERKEEQLLQILKSVQGSSIVYTDTRKSTRTIAEWLQQKGVSAGYYHGGLEHELRNTRQNEWMTGKTRVVVATNAFGMGIDKPDVRTVIHYKLPANLEAYYQEAGRAGRDELQAFAIALFHPNDLQQLEQRWQVAHPPADFLKTVYQSLASYFKLAVGSGLLSTYEIDFDAFFRTYRLNVWQGYHALKLLAEQGLIALTEEGSGSSRLFITASKQLLYQLQVSNPDYDRLIKMLLRLYGGVLLNNYTKISESNLATQLKWSVGHVKEELLALQKENAVEYEPLTELPKITFLHERWEASRLPLNHQLLRQKKAAEFAKLKAVGAYAEASNRCRTAMLVNYFGENYKGYCGTCDYCRSLKVKGAVADKRSDTFIKELLADAPLTVKQLDAKVPAKLKELLPKLLKEMIDFGEVVQLEDGKLMLSS